MTELVVFSLLSCYFLGCMATYGLMGRWGWFTTSLFAVIVCATLAINAHIDFGCQHFIDVDKNECGG